MGIQAEGIRLLEKYAIAPSAARLCFAARLDAPRTYFDTIYSTSASTMHDFEAFA
jgi:hypothetical protein